MTKNKLKLNNKKVLVMGLGNYEQGSGISAVKFLLSKKVQLVVTDLKTRVQLKNQLKRLKKIPGYNKIKFVLGKHRVENFKNIDLIVKNPDVPKDSRFLKIARQNNIPIYNDVTLFFKEYTGEVVGVTGTRGKSTTVSLIYKILKSAQKQTVYLGGNIKVSPLQFVGKVTAKDCVVLELSSWLAADLRQIKYSPHISVITNVLLDHMNKYKKFSEYVADKFVLAKYQTVDDFLIVNKDNLYTKKFGKQSKAQVFWISLKSSSIKNGVYKKGGNLFFVKNNKTQKICAVKDVALLGEHNLYNALAAICVARIKGVSVKEIKKVLKSFKGIDSRLELIRQYQGVRFYNDTTATTPDACLAAIKSFSKKVILIVGGMDKNLKYDELARNLNKKVKKLILFPGTASDKLITLKYFSFPEVAEADNMAQAVAMAFEIAQKQDIILLSPAAASFNMFNNEFDRGCQFVKAVKNLK